MNLSNQLFKVSKELIAKTSKYSIGIFLPLPKEIAKYFPTKAEDDSLPHVTILYIGEIAEKEVEAYKKIVEVALSTTKIGKVYLDKLAFFKNQDGKYIAHNPVRCAGLEDLRNKIWEACEILGLSIGDSFPKFKPHATLAYLDKRKYDGEVFVGSFVPETIEIWGLDRKIKFKVNEKD